MKYFYFLLGIVVGSFGMAIYKNGSQAEGIWLMANGAIGISKMMD